MPLDDALKTTIQEGYRAFLKARGLKPRLGQKQMIAAVAKTLGAIEMDDDEKRISDNGLCVIEAGTGTGKTLAYLLSVLPVARALNKKVVIATATVSLQEQLVIKDIPDLLQHTGWNYKFGLAKGRGRYLCPMKLEQHLDAVDSHQSGQALFEDEWQFNPNAETVKIYQSMGEALAAGQWEGDRDSWAEGVDEETWRPLTVDRRQCAGRNCRHIKNCCFFRARDDLTESDCIVANHDLVMSDLALGGGAILFPPEECIYVFDEGHRLPDIALRHFAAQCQLGSTAKWLQQIEKQLKANDASFLEVEDIHDLCVSVRQDANQAAKQINLVTPLFNSIMEEATEQDAGLETYRFPDGDVGSAIRDASAEVGRSFTILEARLERLSDRLSDLLEEVNCPIPRVDVEQLYQAIGSWLTRTEGATALWALFATSDSDSGAPNARWLTLESGSNMDIRLSCSPIVAAPMLVENLWKRAFGVVVTSATIRALNKFDRFRANAGTFKNAYYEAVAGAFDYANAGVLSVPKIADASDHFAHTEDLIEKLPELINSDEATLVLFASRRQMLAVIDDLPSELANQILMQGDYSHAEIIRRHKELVDAGSGSVIFGLASFAEGVDLPGNYCSHVIIAKIPFAVPNDPIHEALSEWIESRGGKPFFEIALPDASLKLVQACGRLLRTEKDRGTVTILDRRVVTKGYGRQLLDALPPFRREIQ